MASGKKTELTKTEETNETPQELRPTRPLQDLVLPHIYMDTITGLFSLPGCIPVSAPVDAFDDFHSGKVDEPPKTRRPFGNSVNMAMNAIDLDDDLLDHFFMLENPSDAVRNGAEAVLLYLLSELHAKDVTICGLVGGCVARFAQSIPELEHMVDTTEMDKHALLDPSKEKPDF